MPEDGMALQSYLIDVPVTAKLPAYVHFSDR